MTEAAPPAPYPATRRKLAALAGLALLLGLAGLIFAWSGLYNVAATSGHWPVTGWMLHYSMRKSVETHAIPLDAPLLDDPALIERGAGHYETGCAPCHGAPGSPSNRIPNNMVPEPPYLPDVVETWSAEQLFWIVKHGLKYTGMPAWPAQSRDDEVWAVTAFLLKTSGMTAAQYADLAKATGRGTAAPGAEPPLPERPGELFTMSDAALVGACIRCHGLDGSGRPSGAFPRLDIQSGPYLERALSEYASGVRPSGMMQPVAAALDDLRLARLAQFYAGASGPGAPPPDRRDAALLELGREIATAGIPDRQIPPCSACHGLESGPRNALFPALSGQYAEYTQLQLRLWEEGRRGGSAYSDIMEVIVRNITPNEMRAVALFYESLPAGFHAPMPPVVTAP